MSLPAEEAGITGPGVVEEGTGRAGSHSLQPLSHYMRREAGGTVRAQPWWGWGRQWKSMGYTTRREQCGGEQRGPVSLRRAQIPG